MTLTRVKLKRFTAFSNLELELCPGINVLVGANGTGKTHLMKVLYAACDSSKTDVHFAEKLMRVLLPSGRFLGRLVRRQTGSPKRVKGVKETGETYDPIETLASGPVSLVEVYRGDRRLRVSFSNRIKSPNSSYVSVSGADSWKDSSLKSIYIPVKEMLSNAPGFRSLYAEREIHFEEIYADILDRAYIPLLRDKSDDLNRSLLTRLQKEIDGKVTIKNEEFFLKNKKGTLEFTLLAEGMRKLGLLWLLIQNGTLQSGSVLFWDEPETNLNPKLLGTLIDVLLQLQRAGVQVFLATHDYVILKEIDLRTRDEDAVAFHSFYFDEMDEIACHTTSSYLDIHPNAIADTFTDLYNREIERDL